VNNRTGQDCVLYRDSLITYNVVYSPKRKTVSITVYPSGEVRVSAPHRTSDSQIRRLVAEKAGWIDKKLREFKADGGHDATKKYVEGETFLYLGREYQLHLATGDHGPLVTLDDHRLNVVLPAGISGGLQSEIAREAVFEWYRFHAEMAIDSALSIYSPRLGILPPYYKVKNLSRRWGSCTAKNLLNFNAKIAMAPLPQLEYVVAHELCHVKIKDHSPRFWALVGSVMPGYETARKTLRKDGWKYEL
jgi:predicted metal-dependent hydrolase